jgi:hypothetical protein
MACRSGFFAREERDYSGKFSAAKNERHRLVEEPACRAPLLQRSIENCIAALTDRAGTKGPFCSICALLAQNLSQRSKNSKHQYCQVIDMLIF